MPLGHLAQDTQAVGAEAPCVSLSYYVPPDIRTTPSSHQVTDCMSVLSSPGVSPSACGHLCRPQTVGLPQGQSAHPATDVPVTTADTTTPHSKQVPVYTSMNSIQHHSQVSWFNPPLMQ